LRITSSNMTTEASSIGLTTKTVRRDTSWVSDTELDASRVQILRRGAILTGLPKSDVWTFGTTLLYGILQ
jgi:hypothetical protein